MSKLVLDRIPQTNRLLAALSRADFERISSGLEPVTLTFGEVLHEAGDSIGHVYFPDNSLISLLTLVDSDISELSGK